PGTENSYAAPEAERNTPAADVWSLGATFVAALRTESRGNPSIQELTIVPNSIPEPFRRIARECLRPNPSDRCTVEQIRAWLDGKGEPDSVIPPVAVSRRRRIVNLVAIPLVAIAALFGLARAWKSLRPRPTNDNYEFATSAPAKPGTSTAS